VHTIGGLSAHADRDALLGWLRGLRRAPQRTFVVHGEAATACGFADRIADELGWATEAPAALSHVDL
jgi:metallo-beta-lactamase family protein